MTDLRTLLHEAAPTPSRPLDMAAVRRRSQRLGLRRVGVWVGALGVLAGIAVPVAGGLVPSSDPDAGVDVGPGPTTTTTLDPDPDDAAPAPTSIHAADVEASADPSVGPGRGDADGSPLAPTSPGDGAPTTTEATPALASGHPAAPECSVDNEGLGAGEQRRCRFTATKRGGAQMWTSGPVGTAAADVKGEVILTRQGQTTRYEVTRGNARAGEAGVFLGCGSFIEPGDLVEVVLTNGSDVQVHTTTLGAGDGWTC